MTPKDAHRLRELLIVTPNSFVHAYGGVLYLADALWQCGVKVRLLCTLQREYAHLLPQRPYPVIDLAQLPFGGAPKIRFLIRIARIMQEGLRPHTHFIFNDYDYYRQAVWLKHLRPEAQLIHYTTELLTPEEQPTIPRLRFYERHARVPDLIIDVEPHRAQRRQKRFGLDRLPMVLPNTLPAAYFPLPGPPGSLARLAGGHHCPWTASSCSMRARLIPPCPSIVCCRRSAFVRFRYSCSASFGGMLAASSTGNVNCM